MIQTPTVPTLTDPKLIDYVLEEIQTKIAAGLSWLDHAFGKALIKRVISDGREIVFPAVYVGGNDYLKTFPDEHIGNFSFFVIDDGEEVNFTRPGSDVETRFGLIIWFDFRKVFPADHQSRTADHVKEEVLRFFAATGFTRSQIKPVKMYERPGNVYREFTNKEIDTRFNDRPFGMIRIDGVIRFNQKTPC